MTSGTVGVFIFFFTLVCIYPPSPKKASLVAQTVKCLPAMQETWIRSRGQEDPLEKEIATHSSIGAWRTPCTQKPSRRQPMGSQRVDMTQQLSHHHHSHYTGEETEDQKREIICW